MKVGLFFGSFNPIHVGHLILANSMLAFGGLDETWFVVSPQNPFKKKSNLLHEQDRLDMVRLATHDNDRLRASDVEFRMPKPSYTVDTLVVLHEKYPQHDFRLIMGGDNLTHFKKWKNYEQILEYYGVLVFPRPNTPPTDLADHPKIEIVNAPMLDISATFIRKCIREESSIRYLVPDAVVELIERKKFYV
ncbi:MAG: nicotinate (nicotinamide) nucleotide adenylyltransferase [Bacteroidota bacterium]